MHRLIRYLLLLVLACTLLVAVQAPVHAATSQVKNANSYLKLNQQGQVLFIPPKAHILAQVQSIDITNTTGQMIGLYLNGTFIVTMPPGDQTSSSFNFPGTDIFTIPNTNPNSR